MVDPTEVQELEQALAAHETWLTEQGIKVEGDRWGLYARQALLGVEAAGLHLIDRARKLAVEILSSRMRLTCFFIRAVGVSRLGAEIEKRLKEVLQAETHPDAQAQLKRERAAVRQLHDHRVEDVVERRARSAISALKSLLRAIDSRTERMEKRYSAMRKAGLADVAAPGVARSRSEDVWMNAHLESAISEIDWYLSQVHGPASSAPLGFSGPPDSKSWHKVRGDCLLLIKSAGGSAKLQQRLFPAPHPDPKREKKRNETRRSRAKNRTNSGT